MLDANGNRMLAYIEQVCDITPIEKADRLEAVHINGWICVCGKGEFHVGDKGVFFEIDSKLPEEKPFSDMEFLVKKHYKIKTQKIRGEISQGLFMPLSAFNGIVELPIELHADCTELLKVTYSVKEDNKRKAKSINKYQAMYNYHPKLFKNKLIKKLMKYKTFKNIMFFFFGRKKVVTYGDLFWVSKTDEERIQNRPDLLQSGGVWIATEKIDGTSFTATYRKPPHGKPQFYVGSRNVIFNKNNRNKCFYDTNVYTEIAERYDIENVLKDICDKEGLEWVTLQGEIYGAGIQKRDYSMTDIDFRGFNLIYSTCGRLNSNNATEVMEKYYIKWVPILYETRLPETVKEVLEMADGNSEIDGKMREGIVFRSMDGKSSFKAVSNQFLLKYHS